MIEQTEIDQAPKTPGLDAGREDTRQAHWLASVLDRSVRYDPIVNLWYVLDRATGTWDQDADDAGRTRLRVEEAVLAQLGFVNSEFRHDQDQRSRMVAILNRLLDVPNQMRALKALSIQPEYRGSDWDADPYLIGCTGGVIDVRAPERFGVPPYLRPGAPEEHITRRASVTLDKGATCPLFDRFLLQIASGDEDLVAWLWRWYGMALLGDTREHKFLILTGDDGLAEGRNGKGTTNDVMRHVFGSYAHTPSSALYMKTRMGVEKSSAARPDLLKLRGLRLAVMSEPPGGEFNQEMLKEHTGGDIIEARDLYGRSGEMLTFPPSHTIVFLTNRAPTVENIGPAMEDRVRVVRLLERFASAKDGRDLRMAEKLKAEAPGIFARLVREARAWYESMVAEQDALPACRRVDEASAEYVAANWPLARFVDEACEVGDAHRGTDLRDSATALWSAYQDWAAANLEPEDRLKTQSAFGTALGKRYRRVTKSGADRFTGYLGIRHLGAMGIAMAGADDQDD